MIDTSQSICQKIHSYLYKADAYLQIMEHNSSNYRSRVGTGAGVSTLTQGQLQDLVFQLKTRSAYVGIALYIVIAAAT